MGHLAEDHKIRHNFTVAYSPWIDGTVEKANRHIRAACTALLTELKLAPQDWPSTIPLVASILNEAPLPHLGKRPFGTCRSPLKVMTSIQPPRNTLINGSTGSKTLRLDRIRAKQLVPINDFQSSVDQMHKDTAARVTKARRKHIETHNRLTNIIQPSFEVGEFVLVRRAQGKGHELNSRWLEPRQVVKVYRDLVYDVAKLNGGGIEHVHCARMLLYRPARENTQVSNELLDLAERSEAQYELADKIVAIGEDHDSIFFQVCWLGLPGEINFT